MRAPFQILAIPYKFVDEKVLFCVLHRADYDQWQFIAGGGEDCETPLEAAKREILEEAGITVDIIFELNSKCYIPTNIFPEKHRCNWPEDTYVIPEFSFGFECFGEILLSDEHSEYVWLSYEEAFRKLKWDSNKTALYELNCLLEANNDKISKYI